MPVKKYKKGSDIVEAIQWTGDNLEEVISFTGLHPSARKWTWSEFEEVVRKDGLKIFTPKGAKKAAIGDYVVKIGDGFYLCKPSAFSDYEPIND